MFVEKQAAADIALAASAAFAAVPGQDLNMGFQAPNKTQIAEFCYEGFLEVAADGERVDLDISLAKDGGPAAARISGGLPGAGGTEATNGLGGHEANGAAERVFVKIRKLIELPRGNYKASLVYKTTGGSAGTLVGTTYPGNLSVKLTRHVALLPQAVKPQNQLQV